MITMLPFKPTSKTMVVSLVCTCLLLLLSWYLFCLFVPTGSGRILHDVSFPTGSGVKNMARELKSAGIIRSSWHFILVSRLRGQAHRLKAGDYCFNDAMTTTDILNKVVAGNVDYRRFVLPEGYSIYQAAELLEQQGYFKKGDFLEKCRDKALLGRLSIQAASVEGYLYPATYNLQRNETGERLIEQMVGQFNKVYSGIKDGEGRGGLSQHDVVIMASVIEKEAILPEERPLISSVFHNRLRIGMPLQSDPTAVYGVRAFAGKVGKSDIEHRSPYNTYLISGLPSGPIGNPGLAALKAALHPATTEYLYFVARKDGSHQFSRTLDEHNLAVVRYLKH